MDVITCWGWNLEKEKSPRVRRIMSDAPREGFFAPLARRDERSRRGVWMLLGSFSVRKVVKLDSG